MAASKGRTLSVPPVTDRSNPWTTRSTHTPYENQWIAIEHNDVTTPGGSNGVYGVVRFKNYAVGVVPIDEHDHTWLVGQYRYPLDAYSWEIPAGGCPLDEHVEATAFRELREETGLVAARLEPLLEGLQLSNSITDEEAWAFVATGLTLHEAEPEDTEDLTLWRLPVDDAIEMALRGEIKDAFTLMAMLRLHASRNL